MRQITAGKIQVSEITKTNPKQKPPPPKSGVLYIREVLCPSALQRKRKGKRTQTQSSLRTNQP